MQTRKVFISAGHSNSPNSDMGAIGISGLKEGDLAVELRDLIIKELKLLNQYAITDSNSYVTKDTVAIINSILGPRDIAIDLHFNAGAEIIKGTEVLIPFKSSSFEKQLAKILVDNISACLGTRNRGVKTEADSFRGRLIFMTPNCENILIEICFITNKLDVAMYLFKKDVVANVIAKCIFDSLNK